MPMPDRLVHAAVHGPHVNLRAADSFARRDHAQAVYTYAINVLKLKAAAGTLGDDDVAYVNTWLQK